jgi:hypothetical protein
MHPAFHDFSVVDALDRDSSDPNLLAGRGQALELTARVDGAKSDPGCDRIPFGDLLFYLEMRFAEGRIPSANDL